MNRYYLPKLSSSSLCYCSGILIRTLADASQNQQFLSAPQIVFTVIGFCVTAATTVFFTVYAKRKLKELQIDDDQLLQ